MDGGVQYDVSTLAFNNGEQIEYFHSIILRLQQEIIFSGETVYPTKIILQYMKALSKGNKLKALIAPKMAYLITLPSNNVKLAVYTGGNIHGLYCYM